MKFFKEIQQPVKEASRPDAYQRDEINATSGFGKNSYAYRMDGGANDEDHESDRRREQETQSGTWYVRINGKIVKDKAGNPYTFRGKAAANKAALTMQAKPFNKGKEIMLTTNPNDKVAEGWQEDSQELEDWSKEVNKRLYRAHESQRPGLARQLSKVEQKNFGSTLNQGGLTELVHSTLMALQKGQMVHYDPQSVGQMPFGSLVGDDARIIASAGVSSDELAGYRMLSDKGIVDNIHQFLKLRRAVYSKEWPQEYLEQFDGRPGALWLQFVEDLGWSKDDVSEAVQAKTDDKLLAYYAQRKAEAEKKKKEQSITEEGQPSMPYAHQLAQKVFDQNPNLDATGKADAVLDAGWPIAVAELGKKSAQYTFVYDEDFPSDFVSAYAWLQQNQGVAEAHQIPGKDEFYALRNNIWTLYDGDEIVYEYRPERGEIVGAKKLLARFDDEGYDVTHVADPMGVITYLYGKPEEDMDESTLRESDSPVAGAITRRILLQRADLLQKYGPQKVMAAIDEVADFVGDTEEIGSSDVSGWVKHVEQMLGNMGDEVEEDTLSQMRDYFNSDDGSVDVSREYGEPERKNPAVGIPPHIQALVNKMYTAKKITPQEFQVLQNFQKKTKINVGIKEADTSTGNTGYDSMLAVMKAVDAGQDATFNLGGEPVTLEYPEARFLAGRYKAFLKAGRQEEFLKYMESPVAFDRLMKQLRDLMDKQKNFKGSVQGERGVEEAVVTPAAVVNALEPLPQVNENEYWCQIDSMAKPIPEGYKRLANGYITRA